MRDRNSFRGCLVLVTGAASGIGLEIAQAFARAGARLVITEVNAAALDAARAAVTASGAECLAKRCDVSSEEDVLALAGNAHVSPQVSQAQLARLQAYYATRGCPPGEVAEALLGALQRGEPVLFAGPLARLSSTLMRISRRLARRVTLGKAREMGYL